MARWLTLFPALLLAACSQPPSAPSAGRPPPLVEVLPVQAASVRDQVEALGVLRADEALELRAEIGGRVTGIHFSEGAAVRRGQLLVQLDDRALQAELAEAVANRDLARADLQRANQLLAQDLIARSEQERLQAQVAALEAGVARVQATVAQSQVRAPFDGRVGLRRFSPGELVQPGQALASLVSTAAMKLDVAVAETDARLLAAGQPVQVQVPALDEATWEGAVQAIEPRLDDASRALNVRVRLDNPDGRLQTGMTARVIIAVSAARDGLWLPDQAVVAREGRFVVFKVDGDEAVVTDVALGQRRDGQAEIRAGLADGDVVVVSGQNKLNRSRQPVRTQPLGALPAAEA